MDSTRKRFQVLPLVKTAFADWLKHNATRLAASLAFYSILSLAPLFVIITAAAGFIFGDEAATGQIFSQIKGIVGPAGAEVIQSVVKNADRPAEGTFATVLGVLTLLYGASGVFVELQDALNTIWEVPVKSGSGIWNTVRHRFASFGMVLAIGFLLLVSLVLSAALSALTSYAGAMFAESIVLEILNFVLSFFVVTALFAMIFKILPDVRIDWRDVWIGSFVTAALFTIGKYLIGLYLGRAGVATPFGAAGSMVALVIWIYYSGLILFFGAELTQILVKANGRAPVSTNK